MNNQELFEKIVELVSIDNVCDMIIEVKNFEKEYKQTDFYKQTKMSIYEVIEIYKMMNPFDFNKLQDQAQTLISNLTLDNLDSILDKFVGNASLTSKEMTEQIGALKEILGQ